MLLLFSVEKYTPLYIPTECAGSARLKKCPLWAQIDEKFYDCGIILVNNI